MAKDVRFVLDRTVFGDEVLRGKWVMDYLQRHAESVKPSGSSIEVVSDTDTERSRVRIVDTSWGALFRESREGHLSRAIGIAAGDRKVWYTTKSGKRRLASQAQVDNWTRRSRV